jgi:hypothetical protein
MAALCRRSPHSLSAQRASNVDAFNIAITLCRKKWYFSAYEFCRTDGNGRTGGVLNLGHWPKLKR